MPVHQVLVSRFRVWYCWYCWALPRFASIASRDSNNELGTENALAALSSFEDRSLWMEDPHGAVEHEFRGRKVTEEVT